MPSDPELSVLDVAIKEEGADTMEVEVSFTAAELAIIGYAVTRCTENDERFRTNYGMRIIRIMSKLLEAADGPPIQAR